MNKVISLLLFHILNHAFAMNFSKDFSLRTLEVEDFSQKFTKKVFESSEWPVDFKYEHRNFVIDYTLDNELEDYIKKELRRYSSDYASVVVINNNTGQIFVSGGLYKGDKIFWKKS